MSGRSRKTFRRFFINLFCAGNNPFAAVVKKNFLIPEDLWTAVLCSYVRAAFPVYGAACLRLYSIVETEHPQRDYIAVSCLYAILDNETSRRACYLGLSLAGSSDFECHSIDSEIRYI